ncbi:unnamed protein product [Rotaria sp. Silwood1]|nr:unnamed protein product [Rotaria sp. Silwood1]CAF3715562.1 unnamed protein product [Rotaria sp. Silwood1]
MSRFLTKEERIFLLKQWWTSGKTSRIIKAAFQAEFPDTKFPIRQAIYQLARKFDDTGSVEDAPRRGRPATIRTEENMQRVSETFLLNPRTSQRRASLDLGISRRSLDRLMRDLNLKPYKPRLLQALNEDDPDRRMEFCEWILVSTEEDPTLLDRILWTDEAICQINGRVNRHNCVYWSDTNPHLIIEQELNVPQVIVWGGIWSNGVVGPYFFEGKSIPTMIKDDFDLAEFKKVVTAAFESTNGYRFVVDGTQLDLEHEDQFNEQKKIDPVQDLDQS